MENEAKTTPEKIIKKQHSILEYGVLSKKDVVTLTLLGESVLYMQEDNPQVGTEEDLGFVTPYPIQDSALDIYTCLLYTSPSPRDATLSRMPSSA